MLGQTKRVLRDFDLSSRLIQQLILTTGYAGVVTAKNATTDTTYDDLAEQRVDDQDGRDGAPENIILDWTSNSARSTHDQKRDLGGLRQTYWPAFPAEAIAWPRLLRSEWSMQSGGRRFRLHAAQHGVLRLQHRVDAAAGSIPYIVQVGSLKVLPLRWGP